MKKLLLICLVAIFSQPVTADIVYEFSAPCEVIDTGMGVENHCEVFDFSSGLDDVYGTLTFADSQTLTPLADYTFTSGSGATLSPGEYRLDFHFGDLLAGNFVDVSSYFDHDDAISPLEITMNATGTGFNSIGLSLENIYFNGAGNGIGRLALTTTFAFFVTSSGSHVDGIAYDQWALVSVPIPAAIWLFGSGLVGLIGIARRKKS